MAIPFNIEEFLGILGAYNQTIFPLQWIGYLLGLVVIYFVFRPSRIGDRIISGVLAMYWLGMGVGYHLQWFTLINPAAYLFGIAFIIQGMWFLYAGILRPQIHFGFTPSIPGFAGLVFILYAMSVYPLLNIWFGHEYPAMPLFGSAPCPTTIFTFGLLVLARTRLPYYLLVIPFLWSLIGVSAALQLGMWEDLGLVIAGLVGAMLVIYSNRRRI